MSLRKVLKRIRRRLSPADTLTVLRARGVKIGTDLIMMSGVIIDPYHAWHIEIGDEVTLAPRVHILAHDASTKRSLGRTRIGKVTIGDRVFVGAGSIILPGVSIGSDVVIGAGSVVSRDIPAGQLAAGNPARPVCPLDEYMERKRAEMERCPNFGLEYTIDGGVTAAMREEMNERMSGRIGYVV